VAEGEALYVQVTRDPIGDKGPRLTTNLTLPGRRLVFTPLQAGVAVSRRIADEAERARLEDLVAGVSAEDEGFVVRTVAEGAGVEELEAEAERLRQAWREIEERRGQVEVPSCQHREPGPVARALRDHVDAGVRKVRLGRADALSEARRVVDESMPELAGRLELFHGPGALFDLHDIEAEIEAALEPRVALPSGGSLVIESTEALVAIDVNTGPSADARGQRDAGLRTNLEAAREAARQIRLRGLAGLIVIDFIQMRAQADMDQVMAALREALAQDRAPVRVAGPTAFGLAEITRRRVRPSLEWVLTEPCEWCVGGRTKTAQAVAAEILRQAEHEGNQAPGRGVSVTAAPEVVEVLNADGGALGAELERRIGGPLRLAEDEDYAHTEYDLAVE
jgi:ribonuclease G